MMSTARSSTRLLWLLALAAAGCQAPDTGFASTRTSGPMEGDPADVGMSAELLARIGPAMQAEVDSGRTGGIVTLVARSGTIVHWEARGWRIVGEDPLDRNDVFRIYSMTKPVTSVAALMLVEEERLALDQPVADLIPSFASVQVYDEGELRPPVRPMTVRDLMRHTSGLTYGIFGNSAVDRMYREVGPLERDNGRDLEGTVETIAGLPLLADPGSLWNYSVSTDVLGRVVEVASDMTLEDFFRERIFEPLGMHDTGFWVEPRNVDRLTGVYGVVDGALTSLDSPVDGPFTRPPSWFSGGGGLTSTPADYLRFAQMLLNEGELDGVRLLRPETVRDMRMNHLPDELVPIRIGMPFRGTGFGLGFAVDMDGPTAERYWWLGVASTWFWIDPVEEIVAFAWTQYQPTTRMRIDPMLREIVYEAITESSRIPVGG